MTPAPAEPSELLILYLRDRDVHCPQCAYNLHDLTGTLCPECGEHLMLRVAPVEPRQGALLTGLVMLSAAAGFNALLMIYAAVIILTTQWGRGIQRFMIINTLEFIVAGACLILWLMGWREIRQLSFARRRTLVVACAAVALADVTVFARYMS